MHTAFVNSIIFTGSAEITGKALLIKDELITGIVELDAVPAGATVIDGNEGYLIPGLIDLQIYGAGGLLFSEDPSAASLNQIHDAIVHTGTTAFLLTLATNTLEVFRKAIRVVKENPLPALLGLHLEGPYLNPVKKGAHTEAHLKIATMSEVRSLLDEAQGVIKIMTLAPELCDPEIIRLLIENGVVVSAGHSNATFNEANAGFDNGIKTTTHLFNAMSSIHHRDTGLPGATWLSKTVMASIIADGIHIDYNTLTISKKLMGDRLFLITDAVEENLTGPYIHVMQPDRFTLPDGTLSGSRLTLVRAISNSVEHAQIPLPEAVKMASAYPARLMSLNKEGDIQPGYKANLVLVDKSLKVRQVYLQGKRFDGELSVDSIS